jgi:protein-S-isoprenylcysteine O-methyltransferase Ste14
MDTRSPRALIDTPPVWFAGLAVLAWLQARFWPLAPSGTVLRWAGAGLVLGGVLLVVLAALEFRRHRTSIVPRERPRALLTRGPYALSRNPIYLADAMILSGLVLRWDLASLPLVAVFVLVISRRFIRGEEAGCAAAFGADWAGYAARVRRWL